MSKYSALEEYFKKQVEIELTLAEIEKNPWQQIA